MLGPGVYRTNGSARRVWLAGGRPMAVTGRGGRFVSEAAGTGHDRARNRLLTARDSIRRERGEVMSRMGRQLHAWRQRNGIKQQDLAAEGCLSATVVRRI